MSSWKITNKEDGGADVVATTAQVFIPIIPLVSILFGESPVIKNADTYTVQNLETGETKQILAYDAKGVGEKIGDGNFLVEDDD